MTGKLTFFECGPSKCKHDYRGGEDVIEDGKSVGWTAVCIKCGARAIDEAAWGIDAVREGAKE